METAAYRSVPERAGSLGQEAVDVAAVAGLHLDPWQVEAMDTMLSVDANRGWAALECGVVVPRQNGKGSLLETKALHAMYASPSRLIMWSAHEFKTAQEGFLRTKDLIDGCDEFRRQVRKMTTAHGEEGITLIDGTRLRFVARSRGSGRGFSADDLLLDEAMALRWLHVASLLPTLSSRPNPQAWYASSAPLEDSEVLRRVVTRGRAAAAGLAYVEYSAPDGAAGSNPAVRAAANPSTGIRISPEFLAAEFEAMGDSEEYRRERLGIVDLSAIANPAMDMTAWAECRKPSTMEHLRSRLAVVVDVSLDGQRVAACAAAMDGDAVRIEPLAEWSSQAQAREALDALLARVRPAAFGWFPEGPGAPLAAGVKALRGVAATAIRGELSAACMGLSALNDDRRLLHSGDPLLTDQAKVAEKLRQGDKWSFTRKGAGHVHMLYAAAGAAHLALGMRRAPRRESRVMVPA